ncbi:MAG: P-loop NTPase [Spirochaetales bacterium]
MIILPVASGKGGVGKSLTAANLAIALAENGRNVVLADLDLGGSNLHLILGVTGHNGSSGLGTFLSGSDPSFESVIHQTEYRGLRFIPGDGEIPGLANVSAAQKKKLISRLKNIDCDYLILDLGAGTSYNTLDFFLMGSRGLVVTTPTPTATVSAYLFLKNVVFRLIRSSFPSKSPASSYIESLRKGEKGLQRTYIPAMLKHLQELDPERHERCTRQLERFSPRLILNMLEDPKDSDRAQRLRNSCKQYLGLELEHLGVVYRDDLQDIALSSRLPIIRYKPQAILSQAMYRIADKLISFESEDQSFLDFESVEDSYKEASLEAEADFATKTSYIEDLLHTGALTHGDLVETIKMQQVEINQLKKENNLLKSRLVRALKNE